MKTFPSSFFKKFKIKFRARFLLLLCALIFLLSFFINGQLADLQQNLDFITRYDLALTSNSIRQLHMDVSPQLVSEKAEQLSVNAGELLTVVLTLNDYQVTEEALCNLSSPKFVRQRNRLVRFYPEEFTKLTRLYNGLLADMQYFPVPVSTTGFDWVSYVDSWGYERTYGGERAHEGTDVMAGQNRAGIYPVLSVCDGTVTNIGWLELGGYRIGVTSENGIYYYYAHMASYADGIREGDSVSAGQLLGFMGNTGYSKVEGTSGKFDVHLHFGIYITGPDGGELAVNPYYFLKNLENKVLYYRYGM